MERKQVNTILSDYDGTLSPTTAVRGDSGNNINMNMMMIPQELEQILHQISERISVCIISSKDFTFLHKRTRFAKILSCVLGIETVIHTYHNGDNKLEILIVLTCGN